MRPIHSVGQDDVQKRSPRGFGPKARHELLQKLRDKGYLSEEEYARYRLRDWRLKHQELYEQSIKKLDLSVHVFNSLNRSAITTIGDVLDFLRWTGEIQTSGTFGTPVHDELLQKLKEKGYLSNEEYTQFLETGYFVIDSAPVAQDQGLNDKVLLDDFDRNELLYKLLGKGYLSNEQFARYRWPNNYQARKWWLKRNKLYKVPITVLELSEKPFKSLIRTGVNTIGDVLDMLNQFVVPTIRSDRRFDSSPLDELLQKLRDKGYLSDEEYYRHHMAGY